MRTALDCCPVCGHTPIETFWDGVNFEPKYKCHNCGWNNFENDKKEEKQPDPNNPYTDFAKEMSLLHEALKAEGFKDSMVDILSKMAPIIWDRVTNERARKAMGEAIKQSLKADEDIDKEKWKKIGKRMLLE
jgi:predicted  nucleic acid-binding Zn-ribbon protein